jgi:hypothetical protein
MRECENDYFIFLNRIENLIGEFVDDVAPDFFALRRPYFGVLLNTEKGMPDLFLEL